MTDYSSILTDVAAHMNRTDLTSEIPDFITRAEASMNNWLAMNPVRPMVATDSGSTTTATIELPSDYIDTLEITLSDGTNTWPLSRVTQGAEFDWAQERILVPGASYDSTEPQQYKTDSTNITLNETPSASRTYVHTYYAKLAALTSSNSTNWMADNHPDVYLFGTLAWAAFRVRDYDYMNECKQLFEAALAAVPSAYPERARDTALRVNDGPWGQQSWSITNG